MKLIVAGSRDYNNKEKVYKSIELIYRHNPDLEIVSGLATGPDSIGKQWAIENNVPYHEYPALWNKHGKKAGYIRNKEMAVNSDALLAFHKNNSKGTMHMINLAKEYNLKVAVVYV